MVDFNRKACPAITVIMTHYGCEAYLEKAAKSVLNQTFSDLELWIVDDASPTSAWLDRLRDVRRDSRVRLFRSDRNVGTYRLKNTCIQVCKSQYIALQDADDYSLPTRLSLQMQEMRCRRLDLVGTNLRVVDEHDNLLGSRSFPRRCNLLYWLGKKYTLHHPTSLIDRKVIDTIGAFDGATRIGADTDFLMRACRRFHVGNVQSELYVYRERPKSLTNDPRTGFGSNLRNRYNQALKIRQKKQKWQFYPNLQPIPIDTSFNIKEL